MSRIAAFVLLILAGFGCSSSRRTASKHLSRTILVDSVALEGLVQDIYQYNDNAMHHVEQAFLHVRLSEKLLAQGKVTTAQRQLKSARRLDSIAVEEMDDLRERTVHAPQNLFIYKKRKKENYGRHYQYVPRETRRNVAAWSDTPFVHPVDIEKLDRFLRGYWFIRDVPSHPTDPKSPLVRPYGLLPPLQPRDTLWIADIEM